MFKMQTKLKHNSSQKPRLKPNYPTALGDIHNKNTTPLCVLSIGRI